MTTKFTTGAYMPWVGWCHRPMWARWRSPHRTRPVTPSLGSDYAARLVFGLAAAGLRGHRLRTLPPLTLLPMLRISLVTACFDASGSLARKRLMSTVTSSSLSLPPAIGVAAAFLLVVAMADTPF